MATAQSGIPAHVPPDRIVDWDIYHPAGGEEDVHLAWKHLQQANPDIVWTPRNGGHWIALRGEDIRAIQLDHERFSMREVVIPRISKPIRLIPLEVDPPEHTAYRAIISPLFAPNFVQSLEQDARELTIALIEGFRDKGECEFVADFGKRLPIVMFLRLVDLPLSDRDKLLEWTEMSARADTPENRIKAFEYMKDYLSGWVEKRRAAPGRDFISRIVNAKVGTRDATPQEIMEILLVVMFGGLDTVASMLGFFARFMADHPVARRQLIEQPDLIPHAVDELIRRHGVSSTARVINQDMEYKGLHFKKDEQILIWPGLYGLDERQFDHPLEVDFTRKNVIHAAFGNGPHRCPGSYLARLELRVFLEEWLKRIPDFRIKPGEKVRCGAGMVVGVEYLPLVWETSR